MILIGYDGSPDAKAAVQRAAQLLRGHTVTVLTVWEPLYEVFARMPSGFGIGPGMIDFGEADKASRERAERIVAEGVKLARAAGLDAQPRTCSQKTTTADAILSEAEAVGADAIVMGSRGLTGLKSLLLGSVSHAVIQHADRAVIVVPSVDVAASRERARHEMQEEVAGEGARE